VTPGSPVRVESLDPEDADQEVMVFRIPEARLRRLIHKVFGRTGVEQVPLRFVGQGRLGPLSESWEAAQVPPPDKPTRYVAARAGSGSSGPLTVTDSVIFEKEQGVGGGINLDPFALSTLTGLPLPVTVDAEARRRTRIRGVAYGVVDPEVEVRWSSIGSGDPLEEYLDPYVHEVAESFHLPPEELWEAFRDEYQDCFENPAQIGAEARPGSFAINQGESVEVDLDLFPYSPGRTLAAMSLFDPETGTRLTASDLLLLTYTEEGLLYCES
jgi:hypothetical protein